MSDTESPMHVYTVDNHLYDARINSRYHRMRAAHYLRIARASNALTIFLGSSAAAALVVSTPAAGAALAAASAGMGALALVYDPGRRAYDHELLSKQWLRLESDITAFDHAGNATPAQLLAIERARLLIEHEEPPLHEIVLAVCENDITAGAQRWQHAGVRHIPWLLRQLGTWFAIRLPDALRQRIQPTSGQAHA